MIKVLETDQWTSTGNVHDFTLDNFNLQDVHGGDSEAAKVIFGGRGIIKEVEENACPSIGNVWFRPNPETGKLELWKHNYDTSG